METPVGVRRGLFSFTDPLGIFRLRLCLLRIFPCHGWKLVAIVYAAAGR